MSRSFHFLIIFITKSFKKQVQKMNEMVRFLSRDKNHTILQNTKALRKCKITKLIVCYFMQKKWRPFVANALLNWPCAQKNVHPATNVTTTLFLFLNIFVAQIALSLFPFVIGSRLEFMPVRFNRKRSIAVPTTSHS